MRELLEFLDVDLQAARSRPMIHVVEGELHRAERAGAPAWWARDAAGALWPVDGENDSLVQGRRVYYGVRPEDLALAAGPVQGETIDAVVGLVEPVGPHTEVMMKAGHHDLTILMPGRPVVEAGQQVYLRVAVGRAHLFEGDSEERIDVTVFEGSAA